MEGSLCRPSGYPAARLAILNKRYACFNHWCYEEAKRLFLRAAERRSSRKLSTAPVALTYV
jgi:hypothetical protein